jgi:hypothetical protein
VRAELSASAGGGICGVKVEANVSTEFKYENKITSEETAKITTKGVLGKTVVNEVWLTMSLRAKPVYSRKILLWNNNVNGDHRITWHERSGLSIFEMGALGVPSRELHRVENMQFSDIAMSGNGASKNIRFQVLPVLDKDSKKLKDLHIAFSDTGSESWFVYKPDDSYGIQLEGPCDLAWRDWKPQFTFMKA